MMVLLVGGASRCAGMLELKHLGEWRPVTGSDWTLTDVICEHLDSVRLLNGSSLCSGRLEVKSDQSWSSVCEADFDQQDAEVVCKGSGCRSPSGLQWVPCGETEQQDAFCSEPNDVRLVGGASRCAGTLELKHRGEWRPVFGCDWILGDTADAVCERLHCGPFDYGGVMKSSHRSVWLIRPAQPGSALRECPTSEHSLGLCSRSDLCAVVSLQASRGREPSRPESIELVSSDFGVCSAEGAQGAEEELPADHLTS
uniref:SRCR domain-containing protein n=1 Tax=Amphilophus citrinellus TaxID=61819 RepID=A0A3Q0SBT3_AMPCI